MAAAARTAPLPGLPGGRGVVDLGALKPPPAEGAIEAHVGMEILKGMRCGGCFRRIDSGMTLIRFVAARHPQTGKPMMREEKRAACSRRECGYAQKIMEGAVAVSPIEFMWIVEDPDPDGEIAKRIARGGNAARVAGVK